MTTEGAAPSGERHRERAREAAMEWWASCDTIPDVPALIDLMAEFAARVEAETWRQTLREVHEALSSPAYATARMKIDLSLRALASEGRSPDA